MAYDRPPTAPSARGRLVALALAAHLAGCRGGGTLPALFGVDSTSTPIGLTPDTPGAPTGSPNAIDPTGGGGGGGQTPAEPRLSQFQQGLFRGQDPRLVFSHGAYFFSGYVGGNLSLYKSPSMVDLGTPKSFPGLIGGGLGSPFFIDSVGGQKVGAWFLFGSTDLFVNLGDPYENISGWQRAAPLPWSDVGGGNIGVPFDFEVFQNPQDGPYKGRWYLLWARSDKAGYYTEHIYASEITSLSTSSISLGQTASAPGNRIISSRGVGDWGDIIAEAPGVAIRDQTATIAYSGHGASTITYALGLATLRQGADPQLAGSWIDLSHGECDGFPGGSRPVFAKTDQVFGPGVARFVPSTDGSETWMMYNSKIFDTYDPSDPRREVNQPHNEMWARYISLQKIGWMQTTCAGQAYTIPDLGQPMPPGETLGLPAGDPGPTAKSAPFRIEAESMIAFGEVLGPAIQNLPSPQNNTAVLAVTCGNCSSGYKHGNLVELAANVGTSPKRSGLIYRNCPSASSVRISHANVQASLLDLWVKGAEARQILLPATGGDGTYAVDTFEANIGLGDEVRIVYQEGQGTQVNFDYIELVP